MVSLHLDPDTAMNPYCMHAAALREPGCMAVDLDERRTRKNAFAVRPPGHHAEKSTAMGFFFNNISVAARHALKAEWPERVAIIDFDVFHGNGAREDCISGDEKC